MDGQSFEINRVRDSNIRAIQFLFRSIFTLEITILYLYAFRKFVQRYNSLVSFIETVKR